MPRHCTYRFKHGSTHSSMMECLKKFREMFTSWSNNTHSHKYPLRSAKNRILSCEHNTEYSDFVVGTDNWSNLCSFAFAVKRTFRIYFPFAGSQYRRKTLLNALLLESNSAPTFYFNDEDKDTQRLLKSICLMVAAKHRSLIRFRENTSDCRVQNRTV